MITRLRAAFIVGFAGGDHHVFRDGEVVFDAGGIIHVGYDYQGPAERIIDAGQAIVTPGFIDLDALADIDHALLDSWHGADAARDLNWSLDYARHHRRDILCARQMAFRRLYALTRLIRNGITTIMPIAAETHNEWAETTQDLEATARIAQSLGLRAYLGLSYRAGVHVVQPDGGRDIFWSDERGEAGLREALGFADRLAQRNDTLIKPCLLPCRIETLTPELMQATARQAAARGLLVRLHCLQGAFETEYLRNRHGRTALELLEQAGLLNDRLLMPHGIYIGGHSRNPAPYRGEIERIAEAGANVIHCPLTMLRYGHALESFDRFRSAGVNIALGTDSHPADMIRNMDVGVHLSKLVERRLDAGDAAAYFRAATLGGARALHCNDLGRLAPGCAADMAIIDLQDPHVGPIDDPIRTLLLNCTGRDVRSVIVNGRFVMQDRVIPGIDETFMQAEAQRVFEAMRRGYAVRDVRGRDADAIFPQSFAQSRPA